MGQWKLIKGAWDISTRIFLQKAVPQLAFHFDVYMLDIVFQVVASQDWPEVTKYAGLVCAQAHRQELIQDLYKTWHDPQRGTVHGGMIK